MLRNSYLILKIWSRAVIFLVVMLCSTSSQAFAAGEVYQWEDSNGIIHFGNTPPSDAVNPKKLNNKTRGDALIRSTL